MAKKILIVLIVVGLAVARYFLSDESELVPVRDPVDAVEAGDATGSLVLAATRIAAGGAGQPEHWLLRYSPRPDSTRLTLDLPMAPDAAPADAPMTAVLTATPGPDAASFLKELASELGATPPRTTGPPLSRLELSVSVLGTNLSPDTGVVGARVIAGAFSNSPPGDWQVLRAAVAPGRGQFFLALNGVAGTARLLMLDPAEGSFIAGEFARLLSVTPPAAGR